MHDPAWQVVGLAAINTIQIVLLAVINRKGTTLGKKLNGHLEQHMRNG